MAQYIPFPAYHDFAPINISYLFQDEKPAGKHGFLQAQGDRFVFEDGTPVRFWGTCLNSGACFPKKEDAPALAKRLASYGCNMVRLHQMDAEYATPNIFQLERGQRLPDTRHFDADSLDRLDYFLYCLKQEGIYVYLDLLTYRKFKESDGVRNAAALSYCAKPYCLFDPTIIALQKEYNEKLWLHQNPYTGLAYKDDPLFVMCEPVNEVDLFNTFSNTICHEPYVSDFRELLRTWCAEHGVDLDADTVDINDLNIEPLNDFKIQLQQGYFREMFDHLRSIGVKIPLTGVNHSWKYISCKATHGVGDFMDSHLNQRNMVWEPDRKDYRNIAFHSVAEWGGMRNARMRKFGKPFFTSEWDLTYPHKYRAESALMMAATGMLQNWSGFTIHTYAYTNLQNHMHILGKEVSSQTIGNVGYREGIFSTWNDPAKFGMFYHAALITRREDVRPADRKVTVAIRELEATAGFCLGASDKPALTAATELCQIAVDYSGNGKNTVDENTPLVDLSKGEVHSDTGEMYRSWEKGYGTIDTPMTKAVYGKLAQNGTVTLDGMTLTCQNAYAVVALSSLNSEMDLAHSDSMLLTAIGDVNNTGYRSSVIPGKEDPADGLGPILHTEDFGTAPILCEVIEAEISLRTDRRNLAIQAINAEGLVVGNVPVSYQDGCAHFTIGSKYPSIYYLIQAE